MREINRHKATKIILTTLVFLSFCFMFYPFFTSILLAALFGFALEPLVSRYAKKKKRRKLSTALLIFGFFLVVAVPVFFVIYRVIIKVREISKLGIQNTPLYVTLHDALSSLLDSAADLAQKVNMDPQALPDVSGLLQTAGTWLVGGTTAFVASLPEFVLGLFVFTATLYFFLTESKTIKKVTLHLDLLAPAELNKVIHVVQRSSYVSFVSTLIIGAIQATTVALAALFCGYREFFIVFVVTFVVALIPVIGAAPVAIFLSLLSFLQGEIGAGIGLAVASVVAGSIDNLIKPLIVNSSDEDLHPVISLVALIGGLIVYGIPGLLLGPVLTQLAFGIIPILFNKDENFPPPKPILPEKIKKTEAE
jgi:predicted PurR-regulated permease PerM